MVEWAAHLAAIQINRDIHMPCYGHSLISTTAVPLILKISVDLKKSVVAQVVPGVIIP